MLVDWMLQFIGVVDECFMWVQYLDWMDIEWECGIIIKVQNVWLFWWVDKIDYVLYLIDILGYVDFIYEVLCVLEVCEGVVLLVDVV